MKYKILIKYTSTLNKEFYYFYKDEETGEEFVTTEVDKLNAKIKELDRIYGNENIRSVVDITYDVNVITNQDSIFQETTSEDVVDIYKNAYSKVFKEDGE